MGGTPFNSRYSNLGTKTFRLERQKDAYNAMTKKQARARERAIEAIHRIGLVFHDNDFSCAEMHKIIADERAVLGFGRLMIQATWLTVVKDGFCDHKFRDVAFELLYQHYLKSKPKRKTKTKK